MKTVALIWTAMRPATRLSLFSLIAPALVTISACELHPPQVRTTCAQVIALTAAGECEESEKCDKTHAIFLDAILKWFESEKGLERKEQVFLERLQFLWGQTELLDNSPGTNTALCHMQNEANAFAGFLASLQVCDAQKGWECEAASRLLVLIAFLHRTGHNDLRHHFVEKLVALQVARQAFYEAATATLLLLSSAHQPQEQQQPPRGGEDAPDGYSVLSSPASSIISTPSPSTTSFTTPTTTFSTRSSSGASHYSLLSIPEKDAAILTRAITLYNSGEHWEHSLRLCKRLLSIYTRLGKVQQVTNVKQMQNDLVRQLGSSTRRFPLIFWVAVRLGGAEATHHILRGIGDENEEIIRTHLRILHGNTMTFTNCAVTFNASTHPLILVTCIQPSCVEELQSGIPVSHGRIPEYERVHKVNYDVSIFVHSEIVEEKMRLTFLTTDDPLPSLVRKVTVSSQTHMVLPPAVSAARDAAGMRNELEILLSDFSDGRDVTNLDKTLITTHPLWRRLGQRGEVEKMEHVLRQMDEVAEYVGGESGARLTEIIQQVRSLIKEGTMVLDIIMAPPPPPPSSSLSLPPPPSTTTTTTNTKPNAQAQNVESSWLDC